MQESGVWEAPRPLVFDQRVPCFRFHVSRFTKERTKSRADSGGPLKPDFLIPGRHEAASGRIMAPMQ